MNRKIMERRKETIIINNGKKYIFYPEHERIKKENERIKKNNKKLLNELKLAILKLKKSQEMYHENNLKLINNIGGMMKEIKDMGDIFYNKTFIIKELEKEMEGISTYRMIKEGKIASNTVTRLKHNPESLTLDTILKLLLCAKKLKKA